MFSHLIPSRMLSVLVGALLLLFSHIVRADGAVQGFVWNDLDVDQTIETGTNVIAPFGDPNLVNSGIEVGFESVNVLLLNSGGSQVASTTTDASGNYAFASQADGDYTLVFEAPDRFDFSATTPTNDHYATSDPAPAPGDPQTARINVQIVGSDVTTGTQVGLRPLAIFTIETADLNPDPSITQDAIESGKPAFDPFGDCAYGAGDSEVTSNYVANPPTAGSDCYHFDNWVRSNDLMTYTLSVTATNHPDLNGNGLLDEEDEAQNVILEVMLEPIDNGNGIPDLRFESNHITGVPNGCMVASDGVSPVSEITTDVATGNPLLLCNLGRLDNSARIMPISVLATGNSPHGSSFNLSARVISSNNTEQASNVLDGIEMFVSAAPRFDLTKGPNPTYDAVTNPVPNPYNRIVQYAAFVTKDVGNGPELGKAIRWDYSIVSGNGDNRGLASLGDTITFTDFYPDYPNFVLHTCHDDPYSSSSPLPLDGDGNLPYQDDRTANNGVWSCTQANYGDPIQVTITGADTSAQHIPSKGQNGGDVSSASIVVTGSVTVWVSLRDFYLSVNPAWQDGDTPEYGTYPVTNCAGDFDPDSLNAPGDGSLGNYGNGFEPSYGEADGTPASTGNNCAATSVTITPDGRFTKYVGDGNDGMPRRGGPIWPCTSSGIDLVPGQTACGSGDGPVSAGQTWYSSLGWYQQGQAGYSTDLVLCDVIDNALYRPIPFDVPNNPEPDEPAFTMPNPGGTPAISATDFLNEYAYFAPSAGRNTWRNNHASGAADPITGYLPVSVNQDMIDAAADCGTALTNAGTLLWTDEPSTIPGGFNNIVLMKSTINNATSQVSPNSNTYFGGLFEVRETIYGDAGQLGAGTPVLSGMMNFNIANYYTQETDYGVGDFNPNINRGDVHTSHTYGGRLIYQTVDIRIDKGADATLVDAQAQVDAMQQGFAGKDQIYWWLDPMVSNVTGLGTARNVIVQDTLPAHISYNAGCTPEPPAGITGPIISPGTNPGETTLTWNLGDRAPNVDIEPIIICTDSSAFAPAPTDVINNVIISADNVATPEEPRSDMRTIRLLQLGQLALHKAVDQSIDPMDDEQIWTLTWANTSENLPFEPEEVIDVFPWNGDSLQAGNLLSTREGFASDFSGTLQLRAALANPIKLMTDGSTRAANGAWYYTSDASNSINHTPNAASNDLTTGSTNWCLVADFNSGSCPTRFSDVTAVRWKAEIDPASPNFDPLLAGESVSVDMPLSAGRFDSDPSQSSNESGDFYVNRFSAFTGTIEDPVYSNEPFVLVVGFSIGDLLFFDMDQNGQYDSSIDRTAPDGVTVELYDISNNLISSTTTTNGRYLFEKLPEGDYYVRIPASEFQTTLAGWSPANQAVASPNTDDANEDVDHHAISDPLMPGAIRSSGFITLSASQALTGAITGNEPTDDNIAALGRAIIPDHMTNFSLDLGLQANPDLELIKTVDKTQTYASDRINFTLTLRNSGQADALNVVVNDTLPAEFQYVSDSSNGDYDSVSGNWNVGSIAAGETLTLVITVDVL